MEEIALNYNLKSLWYFDDGVLVGRYEEVINVAEELAIKLQAIGLTLNWDTCELYSSITRSSCTTPQITDSKLWTYLGAPLSDGASICYEATIKQSQDLGQKLRSMASKYQRQAMELLKVCTGACRADYVLRGTTCRNEALKLAHACRDDMKKKLAKVLGVDVIQDDTWAQATLPVKMGGLGIRDPTQIWPACLLANTSSVESAWG